MKVKVKRKNEGVERIYHIWENGDNKEQGKVRTREEVIAFLHIQGFFFSLGRNEKHALQTKQRKLK